MNEPPAAVEPVAHSPQWPPLMITVAPTGARRTRKDHPALPISPAEIAATAVACRDAGACMIHLHVRDHNLRHTLDVDIYRPAVKAVREAVGDELIIQATSESVGIYDPEEQMARVRELHPEAVSMAVRELVPDADHERQAADFFAWVRREGILSQYILYSAEEVLWFKDLRNRGVIPGDEVSVLYVLGRYKTDQISEPLDLLPFLEVAGSNSGECPSKESKHAGHGIDHWGMCAFGPREGACALTAALLGGHARVGLENNFFLNDGTRAPDNAALVTQVAKGAALVHRRLASADDARSILSGTR